MRLIQFEDRQGSRKVGIVCGKAINVVSQVNTMHELALLAIAEGNSLERQAQLLNSNTQEDYAAILKENRIL
ncbi:FAH family protein, partial [Herbaspirillum sp. 3C11]